MARFGSQRTGFSQERRAKNRQELLQGLCLESGAGDTVNKREWQCGNVRNSPRSGVWRLLLVDDVSDISIERDFKVIPLKEGIGKADRAWCNDVRPFIRHGAREETIITNLCLFTIWTIHTIHQSPSCTFGTHSFVAPSTSASAYYPPH